MSLPHPGERTATSADEKALVVATLVKAVNAMAHFLPPDVEVVVHDLSRLPNSVVAVAGDVTNRKIGDPATDFLLSKLTAPNSPDEQSYPNHVPDGRVLISHTTLYRDSQGVGFAALCSNTDTSRWDAVQNALGFFTSNRPQPDLGEAISEAFPRDLDELRSSMLDAAIRDVEVPLELMHKRHKVAVVERLRAKSYFTLRDAVPTAAKRLMVSRFTIYNYLREIESAEQGPVTGTDGADIEHNG